MAQKKSWVECLNQKKQEKFVTLEKNFAGIRAGKTLYVGTPKVIARYIQKIPRGKAVSIVKMRNELARKKKADAMCPTSSSIFIRIACEASIEEMAAGKSIDEVIPFWRLIKHDSKIAARLSIDPNWIKHQRDAEGIV